MPDCIPLCRHADETIKQFNGRLAQACTELPITHAELHLFDGRVLVILSSGVEIATKEDVANDLAAEVGEPVMTGLSICCAVAALSVEDQETNGKLFSGARSIERRLQKIFDLGAQDLVDIEIKQMDFFGWVEDPNNAGNVAYVPLKECFALVTWLSEDTGDDDDEGDDEGEGEGEGEDTDTDTEGDDTEGDDTEGDDTEGDDAIIDQDPDGDDDPVPEVIKAKGKSRSKKGES